MFIVTSLNMAPVATGTGAPLISAVFDGDALIAMKGALEATAEAYAAVADNFYDQGNEVEGQVYHEEVHSLLNIISALSNTLDAIDSLDVCPDCGEKKIDHSHPLVDPAEFSDENMAQVMEQFSQEG